MKYKSVFFTLILAICVLMFVMNELSASSSQFLVVKLLSDHDATTAGNSNPDIVGQATQGAVHIVWTETVTYTTYEKDVFYRKMPEGTTINLSEAVPESSMPDSLFVQSSAGDDVCVLWRERTSSGDYYLFLWRSSTNSTKQSPNPVGSYLDVNVTLTDFKCDSVQDSRITWVDSTNGVYLWNEGSNIQTKLSSDQAGHISNFQRVDVNGDIYLTWSEYKNDQSAVFLWDTLSNAVLEITSNGGFPRLFKDKNNTVHLFWSRSYPMAPSNRYYWNNQTKTNELLLEGTDRTLIAASDATENLHIVLYNYGFMPAYYWNVTEGITKEVGIPGQAFGSMNLIGGVDDKVHLFWQASATDTLYYWNSDTLSETLVTPASSYIENNIKVDIDSKGEIHFAWRDSVSDPNMKDVGYWTPSLSSPIILTDSPLFFPAFDLAVDSQDVAHVMYSGQPDILRYWNSQSNRVETIATQSESTFFKIKVVTSSEDEVFAFLSNAKGEQYYWNSEDGEFYLGKSDLVTPIFDKSGNLYAYWASSEAEYHYEGKDIYGAWLFEAKHWVYLPTVIK